MKKRILAMILCLTMMASLAACGHTHTWTDATCTEPQTCSECGKTKGEALGHTWEKATCTEPKTCSICGATEGEALGHTLTEATCTEPAICTVCGATVGEPLGHSWLYATLERPRTCTVCGATDGDPVTVEEVDLSAVENFFYWAMLTDEVIAARYNSSIAYYDTDGNQQKIVVDLTGEKDWRLSNYLWPVGEFLICIWREDGMLLTFCDPEGNTDSVLVTWDELDSVVSGAKKQLFRGDAFPQAKLMPDGMACIYNEETEAPLVYVDPSTIGTGAIRYILPADYVPAYPEVSAADWAFLEWDASGGCYFVETADKTQWGYLDMEGNVIALYTDATNFNNAGYALVSDDCVTYTVIDRDLNVIAENYLTGDGAWISGALLVLEHAHGTNEHYRIR